MRFHDVKCEDTHYYSIVTEQERYGSIGMPTMMDDRGTRLYSWTQGRLAEMRRVAATEALLRAMRPGRRASWFCGLAEHLGCAMVMWGRRLQSYAGLPAQAK
jgi:hypothetical protein